MDPLPMARTPAGVQATSSGYKCALGAEVTCRDRIDGPDEIVFRSRDAGFGHRFTKVPTNNAITINGPLSADLEAGQVLQVACYAAPMTWAYVTVGATVVADPAAAEVVVTLRAGDGNVFPLQNGWLTAGTCFNSVAPPGSDVPTIDVAAKVFKVDTYRYYIASFAGRPYLMLDQGFAEPTVVAADVEDLQFSYVFLFRLQPAETRIVGDVVGTALTNEPTGIDLAALGPTYYTLGTGPERMTNHPANIRAVRVSAVVRAPTQAPEGDFATLPASGNRAARPAEKYRRFLLETSSPTRNLDARAPYYPSWTAGLDAAGKPIDALNKGGG
jgi:hypothetical protein